MGVGAGVAETGVGVESEKVWILFGVRAAFSIMLELARVLLILLLLVLILGVFIVTCNWCCWLFFEWW